MINDKRIIKLKDGIAKQGPVVYWMQRDQRAHDNWALLYAQQEAIKQGSELLVIFNLVDSFLGATARHYNFMFEGLDVVRKELQKHNINFALLIGDPQKTIPQFINEVSARQLISDFNPLKISQLWKEQVSKEIEIPFYEVDAHNVVPCFVASDKLEFAAYTLRPKIHKLLPEFLDEFPDLKKMPKTTRVNQKIEWEDLLDKLNVDKQVGKLDWIKGGSIEADKTLDFFIDNKLLNYNEKRNDPNADAVSDLSPYLHFGNISAQRVAIEVIKRCENSETQKSFLEELIVRRELSDNFCYYNNNYDSFEGFHQWAKTTLNNHRKDKRDYIYSLEDFENHTTHDALWNAAQKEMVHKGKMHGYMRMYWAKKILEWTLTPEDALRIAIYLNDKYSLDGRDPNGYTGIAWSIGGVHDRAWTERNVFGKIRYMNYNGCKRKFNVEEYIERNK